MRVRVPYLRHRFQARTLAFTCRSRIVCDASVPLAVAPQAVHRRCVSVRVMVRVRVTASGEGVGEGEGEN